jgi:hypothetical protein
MKTTAPRLSKEQRGQVLRWLAEGHGSVYIRQQLAARGWPIINRRAINYYRRRYSQRTACPTCGHVTRTVRIELESETAHVM